MAGITRRAGREAAGEGAAAAGAAEEAEVSAVGRAEAAAPRGVGDVMMYYTIAAGIVCGAIVFAYLVISFEDCFFELFRKATALHATGRRGAT